MKTYKFFPCCLLLVFAAGMSGCSAFSSPSVESRDLEMQVQQQNAQLRQLQPAQADMQNEVQALRAEINNLRGQLDDLQQAGGARTIVDKVNRQDAALRQIDDRMALNLDLGPQEQADSASSRPPAAASPSLGTPMTGPAAGNSLPTYGNVSLSGSGAANGGAPEGTLPYQGGQQAQAPSGSTWGQPTPQQPPVQVPKKDTSLALFDAGVNAYNSRNYNDAQRSFNDFLKTYPSHNLASEAQFYLAECNFQRNQFADAALAYDVVIKKYPSSSSTPGAYLKQGISFSKLGQKQAATARLQELIKKYPKSPEAARAKTFLQTNK